MTVASRSAASSHHGWFVTIATTSSPKYPLTTATRHQFGTMPPSSHRVAVGTMRTFTQWHPGSP
jgi:hypothetical protein